MINILDIKQKKIEMLNEQINMLYKSLSLDEVDNEHILSVISSSGEQKEISSLDFADPHIDLNALHELVELLKEKKELQDDVYFSSEANRMRPRNSSFSGSEISMIEEATDGFWERSLCYCRIFTDEASLGKAYNDTRLVPFSNDELAARHSIAEKSSVVLPNGMFCGNYLIWLSMSEGAKDMDPDDFAFIDEDYYRDSQFSKKELLWFISQFGCVPSSMEHCEVFATLEDMGKQYMNDCNCEFSSAAAAGQYLIDKNLAIELPSGRYLDRRKA